MATYTTTSGIGGLLPEQYGPLIVQPVEAASVAVQVGTVVRTNANEFHVPLITEDAGAAWVAEGAEITPDDASFDEDVITPKKLAGLTIISRELAEDSNPAAIAVVGQSLARDMARKLDAAFFGNTTTNGPAGLGSLAGVTDVDAGAAFANADPFAEAISEAEQVGGILRAFVANPADALTLATLKEATGSNRPLLSGDPTVATRRVIQGVPLFTSPAVTAGTVWGIPAGRVLIVMRNDVRLESSSDAYFSSDRVGVKATMRVGFAFPHEAAITKISLTP